MTLQERIDLAQIIAIQREMNGTLQTALAALKIWASKTRYIRRVAARKREARKANKLPAANEQINEKLQPAQADPNNQAIQNDPRETAISSTAAPISSEDPLIPNGAARVTIDPSSGRVRRPYRKRIQKTSELSTSDQTKVDAAAAPADPPTDRVRRPYRKRAQKTAEQPTSDQIKVDAAAAPADPPSGRVRRPYRKRVQKPTEKYLELPNSPIPVS